MDSFWLFFTLFLEAISKVKKARSASSASKEKAPAKTKQATSGDVAKAKKQSHTKLIAEEKNIEVFSLKMS